MTVLGFLVGFAVSPLSNIAASADVSSAFVGSISLSAYNDLLDVASVFYQTLEAKLDPLIAKAFVAVYNRAVMQYNAAVANTNAILSTCTIHTA
jgi:hypothetical protein